MTAGSAMGLRAIQVDKDSLTARLLFGAATIGSGHSRTFRTFVLQRSGTQQQPSAALPAMRTGSQPTPTTPKPQSIIAKPANPGALLPESFPPPSPRHKK